MYKKIIFLLVVVIFTQLVVNSNIESFDTPILPYDCIISINVHEKFDFLLKQLQNIKENVNCKYAVVLNCNQYMLNECYKQREKIDSNVYFHDIPLNKRTGHGSLLQGIYNNIEFSLKMFTFEYFIVASSRNFFSNNLSLHLLQRLESLPVTRDSVDNSMWDTKKNEWRWGNMSNSLLIKHFLKEKKPLYKCAHEGLVFNYAACTNIVKFMETHPDIKDDIFIFDDAVEESALQTIIMNTGEKYYDIGNGCCTNDVIGTNSPNGDVFKFMYKVPRA